MTYRHNSGFCFRINHRFVLDEEYYYQHVHECEKQMTRRFIDDCISIGLVESNIKKITYKPHRENGKFILEAQAQVKEI